MAKINALIGLNNEVTESTNLSALKGIPFVASGA